MQGCITKKRKSSARARNLSLYAPLARKPRFELASINIAFRCRSGIPTPSPPRGSRYPPRYLRTSLHPTVLLSTRLPPSVFCLSGAPVAARRHHRRGGSRLPLPRREARRALCCHLRLQLRRQHGLHRLARRAHDAPTRKAAGVCVYIYIYVCVCVYIYIYIYVSHYISLSMYIYTSARSAGS